MRRRASGRGGAGAMLEVIRRAGTVTRTQLAVETGMSRSAVTQRLDALLARNLVQEVGEGPSTGGRPPSALAFNGRAGLVLTADLGATHSRVGLADLTGEIVEEVAGEIAIADGPEPVMDWVDERFAEVLARADVDPAQVRGIGVGVPGPVEFATGRPVSPPIMPGWDGFSIPDRLRERHRVPVLVDNDVNIMGLGEHWKTWPDVQHLMFVKVGTGIGCGFVTAGAIYRGAQGAAGDIGHIRVATRDDVICECGNIGCLEAVASGRALVRAVRGLGLEVSTSREVVELVRAHHPEVVRLVRQAGRHLGEVLASLVNAFNPEVIVIGGDLADAHEQLFAGVREVVYQRSTPLATRHLQIVPRSLGDRAGITGAAVMAVEHILAPDVVDTVFADGARASV